MNSKKLKIGVCFCLAIFAVLILSACKNSAISPSSTLKAAIGDVNYNSLTEAVEGAKTGDTIKVYDDLDDHKNVVITKPVNIEGIVSSNQVKPRFYGSLTIDLSGEDESTTIENLDIVHDGVDADGINNNTKIGVNLVDGGLVLRSSRISVSDVTTPQEDASGVIISRKKNSASTMPITVEGNRFGSYKTNKKDKSGAMLIKSGGDFASLKLNDSKIYNSNDFNKSQEGNMFLSIDYSRSPEGYSFFVTSSSDELVNALLNNQENGSQFMLIPTFPPTKIIDKPIDVDEKTVVTIDENNNISFGGITFRVGGTMNINGEVSDINLEKVGDHACIIKAEKEK